ncbi:MAG: hypothetical protein IJ593_11475 [Lachnospiraceae bacterium]|nr:hypothetical protein [Lachnospiraceae bacterium]
MKNKFIIKKVFVFLLVLAMGVESLAATVDSSDGAAFITKKEFEELKSSFNQQIELYDASLSRKIDGAITDFLNGLRLGEKNEQRFLSPGDWYCPETGYSAGSSDYTWRYKYGSPRISFSMTEINKNRINTNPQDLWPNTIYAIYCKMDLPAFEADKHSQHKLLISNVNPTKRTAAWTGIAYNASDIIYCLGARMTSDAEFRTFMGFSPLYWGPWRANNVDGGNHVNRNENFYNFTIISGIIGRTVADVYSEFKLTAQDLVQDFGTVKNKNIVFLNDGKTYMNFSLYPVSRNWHFYNSGTTPSTNFEKIWTDLTAPRQNIPDEFVNCWTNPGVLGERYFGRDWRSSTVSYAYDKNLDAQFIISSQIPYRASDPAGINYGNQGADIGKRILWPCVGFEDNYITNWNQLYLTQFDSVAKDKDIDIYQSRFLKDDDENYHVGIINGLPLFKCDKA